MHSDTIRLRELTLRYDVKRDSNGHEIRVGPRLRTPSDSARLLMTVLHGQASEVFSILCLSTRHDVIGYHEVARGTLDSVIVEPREVFKLAILANAASLVLSHSVARNIMGVMCRRSLCGRGQWEPPITPVDTLIAGT